MKIKNTMKVLAVTVFTGLMALVAISPSYAVTPPDAAQDFYNETGVAAINWGGANVNSCINLSYVGTSTESLVTISATAMSFFAPFNVPDANVGTAGVVTYASTLGANTIDGLCNYLNGANTKGPGGSSTYRCVKTNCKGDDLPGVMLKTQTETSGTNALNAAGGFSVLMTTNTVISLGIQPGKGKRVILYQAVANGAAGGAASSMAANSLNVYGQLRKYGAVASATPTNGAGLSKDPYGTVANDTYLVWQSSSTNNVTATEPASGPVYVPWLEFAQDAHVVVRQGVTGSGSAAAQGSSNYLKVMWGEK